MKRIFLDDRLLDSNWGTASADIKNAVSLLELTAKQNGLQNDSSSVSQLNKLKKAIHTFAAIYHSLVLIGKDKIPADYEISGQKAIISLYSALGANQIVYPETFGSSRPLEYLIHNSETEIKRKQPIRIDFSQDDRSVIQSAVSLIRLDEYGNLKKLMKGRMNLLENIATESFRELSSSTVLSTVYKIKENLLPDLIIFGRDFIVDLQYLSLVCDQDSDDRIKSIASHNGVKNINKPLQSHQPIIVKADDIIGNSSAKSFLANSVSSLMFYDPVEKRNPFQGFASYILLCGKPGTGKTMLARYAMSIAQSLAESSKKSLEIVEMDFEDRWQCGPLENVRSQLRTVSTSNHNYIIFMDEIDTKISERENGIDGYRKDVIGEFLRFRGGGSYQNRGNYILLATANQPGLIDKSLIDVFKVLEINGPVSQEEKILLLKKELGFETNPQYQQFLRIKDWDEIGKSLQKYELSGREIHNVACSAFERYRSIALHLGKDAISLTASQIEKKVSEVLIKNEKEFCTYEDDIFSSINEIVTKREFAQRDYLGKSK